MPVKVYCTTSKSLVDADMSNTIADNDLHVYEKEWRPRIADLRAEDAHWNWRSKMYHASKPDEFLHYTLSVEKTAQGLMQLQISTRKSKTSPGDPMVYLDYLAVAPWNREGQAEPPRYKTVGTVLLAQATLASFDRGWDGRLGLHSLPNAASFYRVKGMRSFGCDMSYYGLEYFEFDADSAAAFIGGR